MKLWKVIPKPILVQAHASRATARDDVLSIGPEGYAEFSLVSRRRIAGWSLEPSPSPRELEAAAANTNTKSRATTTPPTEDGDATPKRPASTQPTDQPDSKRARVSTSFGGDGTGDDGDETESPSIQHLQQRQHTLSDDGTTLRAKTLPPTTNVNTTPKRSATVPPAGQPELKKAKLTIPSDGNGNAGKGGFISIRHSSILSKRRALAQPLDQPARKRARVFIPADASGGDSGFDEAPIAPTKYVNAAAKLHALAQPVVQPDANRDRVFVPADRSGGRSGFEEMLSSFFLEATPTLRAATGVPGGNSLEPEQAGMAGIGAKGKDKVDKDKVDKDKVDKDKVEKNKPGKDKVDKSKVDDDSDGVEVVESMSTPASRKWKETTVARSASAKTSKGKQSEQLGTPDTEASPSARKSTARASSSSGKSAAQVARVDESMTANNGSAEEGEESGDDDDDDDESEYEDPQVVKKKLAQADKDLSASCRTCKFNANKAWKIKHETEITQLKREHRAANKLLKDTLKADGIAALKKAKATAEKEKKAAKAKADELFETVKDTCDEKLETFKTKVDAEFKRLKNALAAKEGKIVDLTSQVERVEAQRKKIEKDAADKVKTAEADLKAGTLRLREREKQMKRESQAEIDQWKPEHSKTLKDNQRTIKELTHNVLRKEQELERSEEDLRDARTLLGLEKGRHADTRKKLAEAQVSENQRVNQMLQYERHNKAIKERAASDVARVEEELATYKVNLQQQSIRVVEKQRNNYNLQDALRIKVDLADAGKREIEVLKRQLQAAQAELEVAMGIEDMDVVEVVKGEAVKGEGIKGEAIKGEAIKGETAETV